MLSLQSIADGWQRFFHSPEPVAGIAAFRVAWGLLLLVSGLLLVKDARRFFGPVGWLSAARHSRVFGRSRFSLFSLLPETDAPVWIVLALHLAAALLLTVGLFTRTAAVLAFVTMVSLHHRNPCVFHSGDSLMRLLTFLLIFSHAGEAFSLDVFLATGRFGEDVLASPWAQRLMQIQVAIVYVRTVFWKLRGQRWWNGTAAYYPTQIESFSRLRLPRACGHRLVIATATYGTLAVEFSLGTLIWIDEFRYPVLLAGILLHVALECFLNLQLFGWTMLVSYLVFVSPQDLLRLTHPWADLYANAVR